MDLPAHQLTMTVLMTPDTANFADNVHGGTILKLLEQVSSVSGPVGEFLQHLPTGKVRLIATSGPARNKFAPNVATYREQGLEDIVFDEWFAVYAPAKTPPDVIAKTSAAVQKALASQDVIDGLAQMGLEAKGSTSADLAALLDRDTKRWAPLVKAIGFTAES